MRRFIISVLFVLSSFPVLAEASLPTSVSDSSAVGTESQHSSRYDNNVAKMKTGWMRLIPNQLVGQFAGSIGAYAFGWGWHYGERDRWETDLLFGYVPKSNGSEDHLTFTIKQRYIPWRLPLGRSKNWEVEPLAAGAFVNLIFGEGFWHREPSKYTSGYYGFSNKLRYNVFLGQRIRYNIPSRDRNLVKSISFYYELSRCDHYLDTSQYNKREGVRDNQSLS